MELFVEIKTQTQTSNQFNSVVSMGVNYFPSNRSDDN